MPPEGALAFRLARRKYVPMNPLARLIGWLKPKPKTPEDIAAEQEAARIRYEMKTNRGAAAGSGAGENYQSQRRR